MLIFRHPSDPQRIIDAPPLPRADMVLRFRRWNRLSTAEGESMRYRVMLEIRGLPAHAWSAAAVQVIVDGACANPEPTPNTAARADSRRFQAAVWCADPDLIPNEAIIRIPEHVDNHGDNNLFLRPEQIGHHELPLLCYKVEIEILEIQDWNDRNSSDDSGTLPDRVLSNSDSDEDYPGFHQPSRSGPWPRRTVFRTPGYGDATNASQGIEGSNSGAPADNCAWLGTSGPSGAHPWRFGRGLSAISGGRSPYPPLRFGSVLPVLEHPTSRTGPRYLGDAVHSWGF